MKVVEALEALPAIGPTKAQAIMTRLGISSSRRLKGLGMHQRAALLEVFA
jgi:ribosomal protein S13